MSAMQVLTRRVAARPLAASFTTTVGPHLKLYRRWKTIFPGGPRVLRRNQNAVVLDGGSIGVDEDAWAPVWDACHGIGKLDWKYFENTPKSADDPLLLERIENAEIVITNKVPLLEEHFAANPTIKLCCVVATGYNVVDIAAAKKHGVTVCNVPTYGTESTAQHTIALIMELTNRVGLHNVAVQNGEWYNAEHFFFAKRKGRQIMRSKIGIIGGGRIGSRVAEILAGFMPDAIIGYSRSKNSQTDEKDGGPCRNMCPMWRWADDVEEIFKECDIISLHCPLTEENRHLVNERTLGLMKPDSYLVNCSRGPLVDESALAAAIKDGKIAGAALDVLAIEPMDKNQPSPCLGHEDIVLNPHLGWHTKESQKGLVDITMANILCYLNDTPENVVSN